MAISQLVFVGTYTEPILFGTGKVYQGGGKGIYILGLDGETGAMEPLAIAEGIRNPSYLAFGPGNEFLYVVNELKEFQGRDSGALSSFAFDRESLALRLLDTRPTGGADPCHVAVDREGSFVAVANYSGGSVSVFPALEGGRLGEASAFSRHSGSSVDPVRQAAPHAHSAVFAPSNRALLVADLGLDEIVAYDFDPATGSLGRNEARSVATAPGSGPRYLEFHPSGRFAYIVNELASTVTAYSAADGGESLAPMRSLSTLPPGFSVASTGADLHISPRGDFLYVSNRGHDSIAIFGIDAETGSLRALGHESTRGKTPRNFALDRDGRFLLVANQDSGTVVLFRIDEATGWPEYAGATAAVPNPVCVKTIEA